MRLPCETFLLLLQCRFRWTVFVKEWAADIPTQPTPGGSAGAHIEDMIATDLGNRY